ncbi:DDE_3 domain-containing protein [Trichonephila clavipes]|nr:DDE_3 domain-containing protein [Trichonephila clavipes]
MDDSARPHRALLVDAFLESGDTGRIDWPARSPDLNPIEQRVKAVTSKCLGGPQADRDRLNAHPGYRACLGRCGVGNCNSKPPENHPGNENSVAKRVEPIATRTDKLPYFKYGITLRAKLVSGHLQGVLSSNWDGTEPNRTDTCMLLKATDNDRRTSSRHPFAAMNFVGLNMTPSDSWKLATATTFNYNKYTSVEIH